MIIVWTNRAEFCLDHIILYLKNNDVDSETVRKIITTVKDAPKKLLQFPRMGQPIENDANEELYRLLVGDYKLYYEIQEDVIAILDIIHAKQDTQGIVIKVSEE